MPAVSNTSRAVRLAFATITFGAILFLTAGTAAWPVAWAYLSIVTTSLLVYSSILLRRHPDLNEERAHPPADAKKWDRPFVAIVGGVGPVVLIGLCGLDHRLQWSAPMPAWLIAAGLLVVVVGHVITNCAVATNRFYRVQVLP